MSRKKIIAGNWKMYKSQSEAIALTAAIAEGISHQPPTAEVWIAPPFLYVAKLISQFGNSGLAFGAQDCSAHDEGAYTGEISASMLHSLHARFVLVGHSERRAYHQETDIQIALKIDAALRNSITAVYCCGETLDERNTGRHFDVVRAQVSEALFHLPALAFEKIVIAYEPVWAIGTGVTASPEQAQEMHAFIRSLIEQQYDTALAAQLSILYGGSVKPNNAATLFAQPDIDGALVGGASLVASDFLSIIAAG